MYLQNKCLFYTADSGTYDYPKHIFKESTYYVNGWQNVCFDPKNVCVETNKCMKHCVGENHFHCAMVECSEIQLCKENNNSMCIKHCIVPNHNHCIISPCDETQNFCKFKPESDDEEDDEEDDDEEDEDVTSNYNICVAHCDSKIHDHCSEKCDRTDYFCECMEKYSICMYCCVECTDHCQENGCRELDFCGYCDECKCKDCCRCSPSEIYKRERVHGDSDEEDGDEEDFDEEDGDENDEEDFNNLK